MADEPLSLAVGTGVSAKYKGAFCEAKIRKVVRSVKCKVLFKNNQGSYTVADDQIKGNIRTGGVVEVRHPDKKEYSEATITKIQDCSQYTVVFDDGDITTLRRTALCLKSGKHFAESETLDQLPLTHPEHFSTPVIGGRRGRRTRIGANEASSDEEGSYHPSNDFAVFKETEIGRVVCVEGGEKRKNRDNWFPALIVAPTAQESVPIRVRDEYLVRSFKDGRYYTVPKKEIMEFSREMGAKAETNSLKSAVEKALQYLDLNELPLHWDRDLLLYGVTDAGSESEPGEDNESSDDEPREKKDHFVAQLYKFMDENGTPINEEPVIGNKDVDLFRLYKVVHNGGGFNRVTNQNNWKAVSMKLGFGHNPVIIGMVKQSYRKYLLSFEGWPKRPGSTMQIQPRLSRSRSRVGSGRSSALKDPAGSSPTIKTEPVDIIPEASTSSATEPVTPVPLKMSVVPIKETSVVLPKPAVVAPVVKASAKKTAPTSTPSTPTKTPIENPRIMNKELKAEPGLKLRNPKVRGVEAEPIVIKQEIKEEEPEEPVTPVSKEKKKRVVPRVAKKDKDVPLAKSGKVDCLANTRQKRVIKERLKTAADSFKARNKPATATEKELPEKVTPVKMKVKDEPGVATKTHKKEETARLPLTEEKRKGRKRKEKSEVVVDAYFEPTTLPPYKTISLGDKLKVYYGPTRGEAKITSYEAKVLSSKAENGETLYFVHYTGWNVRYDEWIRADRIADNLSWVAGRASKKPTQTPVPKSAKKEKKLGSSKSELKADATKANISKEGGSISSANGSSKDAHGNRQGSVGRSTTPSSIASSSSRSKGTVPKRPKTRATYSKKDDDVIEVYDSDVCSEADDKNAIAPLLEREVSPPPLSKTKKSGKDELSPDVTLVKEEREESSSYEEEEAGEDEDGGGKGKSQCDREPVPLSKGDVSSEPKIDDDLDIKIEVEEDTEDDDGTMKADDPEDEYDDDDLEMLIQNSVVKEEYSDDSLGRETPLLNLDVPTLDSGSKENTSQSVEEFLDGKSRSGSDNSDAGGGSTAEETLLGEVENEIKKENDNTTEPLSEVEMKEVESNKAEPPTAEMDTEDVYEFKEPEPFEFESRKSSDDKGKGIKRALCLQLDDKPQSPKSPKYRKISSPSPLEPKPYQSPSELLSKDDNSPESTPTIQTCEEAFDKICASPLRAATLLENMGPFEGDNFDDDSEDRLVISERDSDNSNISFDASGIDFSEAPDIKAETPADKHSKDELHKEEETDKIATKPAAATVEVEVTSEEDTQIELPKVSSPKENTFESEESENSTQETKVPTPKELPLEDKTDKDNDSLAADEEMDLDDVASDQEEESQPEASVIDTCPENPTLVEDDAKPEPAEDLNSGATAEVDEDENNIESLICEETIPGSPPSQLDSLSQIEEKHIVMEDDNNTFKNEPDVSSAVREATETKPVQVVRAGRCPSTTPDSNESSTPSPPRESESTSNPNKGKSDKDVTDSTIPNQPSFKKDGGKGSTDSRSKKVEAKTPAKRGRKSKKKSEEATTSKKKYSKHVKHQGSESDDGNYDGSGRGDSSSRAHHPYRKNFLLPPEKLALMDNCQRIAAITQAMQDLRTTYNNHKSELAAIDKRRKRIRRREREDAARLSSRRSISPDPPIIKRRRTSRN